MVGDSLDLCWFVGLISFFSPPMDYLVYVWVYCLIQAWGRVFYHVWWDVDSFMPCTWVYAFPCLFLYFEKSKKIFVYFQGNFGKMCFVCSYFGHFVLELHSWMFFFLSGKCMHGLRVSLVDSRILYAKVVGLRTFRGPWSLSSRKCGKMELLSIADLQPLVGICLVIIPCELHLF